MEISFVFLLLPGLVAFGVSKALRGAKAQAVNEVIIDLVLQTVFVFIFYHLVSIYLTFSLPKIGEVAYASMKIKTDEIKVENFIDLFERALFGAILIAILSGVASSVLFKELRLVQKLGKKFKLFQNDAHDSAWKTTFIDGSLDGWVHVDTKGGIRYIGRSHSISWDYKDGGIGLKEVHIFNGTETEYVAEYIYIPSNETDGPILFIK